MLARNLAPRYTLAATFPLSFRQDYSFHQYLNWEIERVKREIDGLELSMDEYKEIEEIDGCGALEEDG